MAGLAGYGDITQVLASTAPVNMRQPGGADRIAADVALVEGRTVAIEYRWANNQGQRLAPLAAELVQRREAVIVAIDSGPTVLAAKAATSTIPIVFSLASDPIKFGLVTS